MQQEITPDFSVKTVHQITNVTKIYLGTKGKYVEKKREISYVDCAKKDISTKKDYRITWERNIMGKNGTIVSFAQKHFFTGNA